MTHAHPSHDAGHDARLKRLRDGGHKLTHARLTVLHALEQFPGHPTSAELVAAVDALDPAIGRASVFRALELFGQLALVRPAYVGPGGPVYVLLPGGHHHHIVCVNCNTTIEFDQCGLEQLEAELARRYGVQITGHLLEFYGVCEDCKEQ